MARIKKLLKRFIVIIEATETTRSYRRRYCSTDHNLNDILSPGIAATKNTHSLLWRHGVSCIITLTVLIDRYTKTFATEY